MLAQAFNPNTREAEAGRSLRVQGQPGLQEPRASSRTGSKSYRETLSQKQKQKQTNKKETTEGQARTTGEEL